MAYGKLGENMDWEGNNMANQHTKNHNEAFTLRGATLHNPQFEAVVKQRDVLIDNAGLDKIPWVQYHRANVPHLARQSNQP